MHASQPSLKRSIELKDELPWLREDRIQSRWIRAQPDVENFALELQTTVPICATSGLEVTNLPMAFGFTCEEDPRLITRSNTRSIYSAIFEQIRDHPEERKFLVEGAPGTGKSRNLTYLLKLLLCAGRTVLYENRKGNCVTALIPEPTKVATSPGKSSASPAPTATATHTPIAYHCYHTDSYTFHETGGVSDVVNPKSIVFQTRPYGGAR
jgi:hypothetical protein